MEGGPLIESRRNQLLSILSIIALSTALGCSSLNIGGSQSQRTTWELDELLIGTRVELDGYAEEGGIVRARKVTIEEPGPYPEIKGTISSIDQDERRLTVPPFTIQFTDTTDIDDDSDEGDSYTFDELMVGWRIEVEVDPQPDRSLTAVEVAVDKVPDDDKIGLTEIEAFVEQVQRAPEADYLEVTLLGQKCIVEESVTRAIQGSSRLAGRAMPIRDDDDVRGVAVELELGSTKLFIGGAAGLDYEMRDNYELDRDQDRDVGTTDGDLTLEFDWFISNNMFAFLKLSSGRAEVIYDEDRDLELGEESKVTEAYAYWRNIADYPIALQLGRQRFEDSREWYYDEELDGARFIWFLDQFQIEYSISAFLRDNKDRDDIVNQFFSISYEYASKSDLTFHVVDVVDHSDEDASPFYVGLSAVGRWKGDEHAVRYWAQYSYLDGVLGTQELQAHAVDFGGAIQWKERPYRPYLFAGYAWAQGDDSPGGSTSNRYVQSGYQDNNDKLFGVVSYRYYGELFRPELSNLIVWTGGIGVRPVQWMSVDLVYHQYMQDVASNSLGASRLRASPGGNSTDIGQEIDLVIGLDKVWGDWDLEIDFGHFLPGAAFESNDDPATWLAVQLEYNF